MRRARLSVLFIYFMLTIGLFVLSVTVMSIPMVWVLAPLWGPAALTHVVIWLGCLFAGPDRFLDWYNKLLIASIEKEKKS